MQPSRTEERKTRGLGGIFTEALADVTFGVTPLTETDAEEMIDEIKAAGMLGDFRGEAAADRQQLIDTLLGLSQIGQNEPEIAEVDINPLIITPDGKIRAVDALIIKESSRKQQPSLPPIDPRHLGKLFSPRSIAFIGASGQMGKWGHMLFANTLSNGYEGEVYLVNPVRDKIADRKTYKSVKDIPGPVDLAVVTVPAARVCDLIPGLAEKGVTNMLLITSGFAVIGPEGKALEKQVVEKAREAGILIVGPNTMGISPVIWADNCSISLNSRALKSGPSAVRATRPW